MCLLEDLLFTICPIILFLPFLGYGLHLASKYIDVKQTEAINSIEKNEIERSKLIKDIVIDNTAIEALDNLITDIINEYVTLEIIPQDIQYINSNIETELRDYVVDEIGNRISDVLIKKLSYVCNEDYINKFIGKHIYISVTDFRVAYNTRNKNA